MKTWVRSLAFLSGLRIQCAMRCGIGHRHGSVSALLWLWCRSAAVALNRHLAWKLPYGPKETKKKKKVMISSLFPILRPLSDSEYYSHENLPSETLQYHPSVYNDNSRRPALLGIFSCNSVHGTEQYQGHVRTGRSGARRRKNT